jgi:hypothetical protein
MQSRKITLYDIHRIEKNTWSHYTNQILCVFNDKIIVQAMKAYVRVELQLHLFSNLVLDRGEWLALLSGRFIP